MQVLKDHISQLSLPVFMVAIHILEELEDQSTNILYKK